MIEELDNFRVDSVTINKKTGMGLNFRKDMLALNVGGNNCLLQNLAVVKVK